MSPQLSPFMDPKRPNDRFSFGDKVSLAVDGGAAISAFAPSLLSAGRAYLGQAALRTAEPTITDLAFGSDKYGLLAPEVSGVRASGGAITVGTRVAQGEALDVAINSRAYSLISPDIAVTRGAAKFASPFGGGRPVALPRPGDPNFIGPLEFVGPRLPAAAETTVAGEARAGTALQTYWPPNRGFQGAPITEELATGTRIDRYGYEGGTFLAPEGTPDWMRALEPGTTTSKPYNVYQVVNPIEVQSGKAAPWFNQVGGGTQYELPMSVSDAIAKGHLRRVGP